MTAIEMTENADMMEIEIGTGIVTSGGTMTGIAIDTASTTGTGVIRIVIDIRIVTDGDNCRYAYPAFIDRITNR